MSEVCLDQAYKALPASNEGELDPVYGNPESELITVAGSGASVYKHLPGFMTPIVHEHYAELNFKGGKLLGKLGKVGDFVSTTGALINLQNDPGNPEYWADLFFAGVGWFPVLGDVTTTLYTAGKDQVYIRQNNIRNNQNPIHDVYVPTTGDVWFGY